MSTTIIGQTERLQALFLPGGGDVLLITFNGMGMRPDGKTFAAASVAAKLGMPAIGIVSTEPNWFPEPDMAELLPQLEPHLGIRSKRLAYGFSMGGYGALKYSRAVGATAVLSLSPQSSVDPGFVPWDHRYRKYIRDFHRGERLKPGDAAGFICVIADLMHEDDRRHVDIAHEVCGFDTVNALGVGHATFELFLSSNIMRDLFSHVLSQDLLAIRSLVRERKRVLRDYPARLWLTRARSLLASERYPQAIAAAERVMEFDPQSIRALVVAAKSHLGMLHLEGAEQAIGRAEAIETSELWLRHEVQRLRRSVRELA